jgi:hypothetical protein
MKIDSMIMIMPIGLTHNVKTLKIVILLKLKYKVLISLPNKYKFK